jgi:hypothetical protein
MKKSLLFSVVLCLIYVYHADAQLSGLMNKAKGAVAGEISGEPNKNQDEPAPEPACACEPAELIVDLGGKLNVDYTEIGISQQDDGSLLLNNQASGDYYIVRNGQTTGPYKADDPQIVKFGVTQNGENNVSDIPTKYKEYISKSGDKFLITFMGKTYGPYALINDFIVPKSKDKFAAMVVEDLIITEDQGKKMDEAIKNAKSDEERMALSMKYAQQMSSDMMNANGNPKDVTPKFVTNIPGTTYDLMGSFGGQLNGTLKYDDILVLAPDKIMDLKGNTLLFLTQGNCNTDEMFVNSANTKYACYSFGTLTFSDKTTMSELFSPHLLKTDGKVYLAYMYYSPKRNSIMQCKILF